MITYSTTDYQDLFDKATLDLATHYIDESYTVGSCDPYIEGTSTTTGEDKTHVYKPELTFTKAENPAKTDDKDYYYYDSEEKTMTLVTVFDDEDKDDYYTITDDKGICSLAEYFSWIEELSVIKPEVYDRIPLDESLFDINLNTRAIKIPPDFVTNGIGVVGDHRAEYLWFSVDRYYDATDLATRQCHIEWTAPNGDKGISEIWGWNNGTDTVEAESGDNRSFNRTQIAQNGYDLETKPGKIIFGWCLNNKLTGTAGNITFSVRFFDLDLNNKCIFSLATQTETIAVKTGLNYGVIDTELTKEGYVYDNDAATLIDRFTNSAIKTVVTGDSAKEAMFAPVVLGSTTYFNLPTTLNLGYSKISSYEEKWNGTNSEPIQYPISAMSCDGGRISYVWAGHELGETTNIDIASDLISTATGDTIPYSSTATLADGSTATYKKRYYDVTTMESIDTTDNTFGDTEEENIYERFSMGTLKQPGEYVVYVKNRLGRSSVTIVSTSCVISTAEAPSNVAIASNSSTFAVDNTTNEIISTVTLSASADCEPAEAVALFYNYYKAPLSTAGIPEADSSDWAQISTGTSVRLDSTNNELEITEPGYYKVEALNRLNHTESEAVMSENHVRVTTKVSTPVIEGYYLNSTSRAISTATRTTIEYYGDNSEAAEAAGNPQKPVIIINAESKNASNEVREEGEGISYQWYIFNDSYKSSTAQHRTKDALLDGEFTINDFIADKDVKIKTADDVYATGSSIAIDDYKDILFNGNTPTIFCVITNTYNGETSQIVSRGFDINKVYSAS